MAEYILNPSRQNIETQEKVFKVTIYFPNDREIVVRMTDEQFANLSENYAVKYRNMCKFMTADNEEIWLTPIDIIMIKTKRVG